MCLIYFVWNYYHCSLNTPDIAKSGSFLGNSVSVRVCEKMFLKFKSDIFIEEKVEKCL